MRAASWVFVLCAVIGAVAAFLPSVELQLRGKAVSKRTQVSLYQASSDRDRVRRLLASYRASAKREVGHELVRKVAPRAGGKLRSALDNARDAMDTLDEVSDDDVHTAGTVFAIALWTLLALDAAMAALVFTQLMSERYRRGRMVLALIAALLAAAIAFALHLAAREAVWQANDELGHPTVSLAAGTYLLPLAAMAALIASIVLVVRAGRPQLHQ